MGIQQLMSKGLSSRLNTTGVAGTGGPGSLVGWSLITGSLVNSTTSDGKSLYVVADESSSDATLVVAGFGADPGAGGWATTIIVDGVPRSLASASQSYSGGESTWVWAADPFGFVDTQAFTLVIS